jgi:hypothetical protein
MLRGIFLIFICFNHSNLLKAPRTDFHSKLEGCFGPPAVSTRVNYTKLAVGKLITPDAMKMHTFVLNIE